MTQFRNTNDTISIILMKNLQCTPCFEKLVSLKFQLVLIVGIHILTIEII
jgi:hypothetical protein